MDGPKLMLVSLLILAASPTAHGQPLEKKLKLKGALGIGFFEKKLDFQASPSLGLGAGYNISDLLQLNLTFSSNSIIL